VMRFSQKCMPAVFPASQKRGSHPELLDQDVAERKLHQPINRHAGGSAKVWAPCRDVAEHRPVELGLPPFLLKHAVSSELPLRASSPKERGPVESNQHNLIGLVYILTTGQTGAASPFGCLKSPYNAEKRQFNSF